jgi:hypothetical protein
VRDVLETHASWSRWSTVSGSAPTAQTWRTRSRQQAPARAAPRAP